MRATVMFEAGDVRIENVPDPRIIEPTDAVVTVTRACICGSDLWPYNKMEHIDSGRIMGHEAIGVVEAVGNEVRKIKVGDFVIMPFAFSAARVSSVAKVFRPLASTADSSAPPKSRVPRRKLCACPWRMEHCSCCRLDKTKR